jgi:hypothetical protein
LICIVIFCIVFTGVLDSVQTRVAVCIAFLIGIFLFIGLKLGYKTYYIYEELTGELKIAPSLSLASSAQVGSGRKLGQIAQSMQLCTLSERGIKLTDEELPLLDDATAAKLRGSKLDTQMEFCVKGREKYKNLIIKIGVQQAFKLKSAQIDA